MPAAEVTIRRRTYGVGSRSWFETLQNTIALTRLTTRFYLPSSGVAPISPAFNAGWDETGDAVRRTMSPTAIASAMATQDITAVASPGDTLFAQYVSAPLVAQTINAPIRCQARTAEALGTADAISRILVKVVSTDGSTIRGTLLTLADYSTGAEWNTTLRNKTFADSDTPTSVDALDGDRLVIEIGANHAAAAVTLSMSFGDDSGTDLPLDETTTAANNPWIEFGQNIVFLALLPPGLNGMLERYDYDAPLWNTMRRLRSEQARLPTWTFQGLSYNLLGQDTIYSDPGQAPPYDRSTAPNPLTLGPRFENKSFLRDRINTTLLGQDVIYGDPGQAPEYDWQMAPPPPGQPPHHENRTFHIDRINTTLLAQDQIYGDPGQTIPDRSVTLPPPGAAPHHENKTHLSFRIATTLLGQDVIYGDPGQAANYDHQHKLPDLGRARGIALRDFRNWSITNTLLGQDIVYGDPGQAPAYFWQAALPLLGLPHGENRTWVQQHINLVLSVVVPDSIYGDPGQVPLRDMPLPRLLLPRLLPTFTGDLLRSTLLGQDQIYGDPGQIPVLDLGMPRRALPPVLPSYAQDLIRTTLLAQDTFYGAPGQPVSLDLGMPRRALPPVLPTHVQELIRTTLLAQDTIYGEPGQAPPGVERTMLWPRGMELRIASRMRWADYGLHDVLLGQDRIYGDPGQANLYAATTLPRRAPIPVQVDHRGIIVILTSVPIVLVGPGTVTVTDSALHEASLTDSVLYEVFLDDVSLGIVIVTDYPTEG